MYKLFELSAFSKPEITPVIHAVQYDTARVIPVKIPDLDFAKIKTTDSGQIAVYKPSGLRTCYPCKIVYGKMPRPYKVGSRIYRKSDAYFLMDDEGVYTLVDFDDLEVGVTYYSSFHAVILAPLIQQSLAEAGTAIGQIQLNGNEDAEFRQLSTYKFFIEVEKNYNDGIISKDEYENVNKLLDEMKKLIADVPWLEFTEDEMNDVWDEPLPVDPTEG